MRQGAHVVVRLRLCNECPYGRVCGGTLRRCDKGMTRAGVRDEGAKCPDGRW